LLTFLLTHVRAHHQSSSNSLNCVKLCAEAQTEAPTRLAPAERAFGVLDELETTVAASFEIETRLLARTDVAVPMITALDARVRTLGGVILTVAGTSQLTPTTLSWPTQLAGVVLTDNPVGNEAGVVQFATEVDVNEFLRVVTDAAEGRGVAIGPLRVLMTFLQNTMLNSLEHGGGRGHVAVCLGRTALHACVCDSGQGVSRAIAGRLQDPQEALSLVIDGARRGGLRTVAADAYRYLGTTLTFRTDTVEVQLGADAADSLEASRYRRRSAVVGTYAALTVPQGTTR
jgi:hypothetical protein